MFRGGSQSESEIIPSQLETGNTVERITAIETGRLSKEDRKA
jgi:hypothetical protein